MAMTPYKNLGGRSNIAGYDLTPCGIEVYFRDRYVYVFAEAIVGTDKIAKMRELALKGRGLNGFIFRNVRTSYIMKRAWT
jgi:hypothetical protein